MYTDICIIVVITFVGVYVYSQFNALMTQNHKLGLRVVQLSNSCQLAEIHTGTPYFTSLNRTICELEHPDYIYDALNEKLNDIHETIVQARNVQH